MVTRRLLSSLAAAAAALASPALASACPQCAGRADGGVAQWLVLGAFVTFPFAVVAVVMKVVKRNERRDGTAPDSSLALVRRQPE